MKNTKHQKPNFKEIPNTNLQAWSCTTGEDVARDVLILRDGPTSDGVGQHPFDLEERTAVFGENIVRLSKTIPRDPTNNRLIDQLVGSGTSVGGNYCEANDCVSKKDFRFTVKRCVKEAKEARFFLRMIATSEPGLADQARPLYREATELVRILATMYRK